MEKLPKKLLPQANRPWLGAACAYFIRKGIDKAIYLCYNNQGAENDLW